LFDAVDHATLIDHAFTEFTMSPWIGCDPSLLGALSTSPSDPSCQR